MFPVSEIFVVRSSHWQQRTGRRGGKINNWFWVTREIYLLERMLQVGDAMVNSKLR